MTRLLAILLLLPAIASAAGLGVYNPAQHAVNGFMPTQLPDLQLWLDANKIGLTNGASVDVWQDFSGKSNWATNGTGSKRPIVSAINGRTALSFDGVDDSLAIESYKTQTKMTFWVVIKQQNSTDLFFCEHGANNNTTPGFGLYGGTLQTVQVNRDSDVHRANADSGNGWLGTNQNTVAYVYGTNWFLYKNNKTESLTAAGTTRNNTSVTNTLYICSRAFSSIFSKALISEVIATTNDASVSVISQVNRYLGTKYGIVVQ